MNDAGTDAASRLWWAGRRLLPMVVVLVIGGGVVGASQAPAVLGDGADPVYEARALVLATQLELEPELLPKTAVAIFESGRVANSVLATGQVDVAHSEVVPEVVDIDPVENSVALQVLGRHTDPDVAAELSNVAALALVTELNRPGDLFGRFVLQERASPPSEAEDALGAAMGAAIGVAAGLAFALGIIGLYVAMRRPVLTATETAAIAGAPVLGAPRFPKRGQVDPLRVPGLAALSKRVFPERSETAVIVGVPGDRGERSKVALLLARVVGRSGPVYLVTEDELPEAVTPVERRNIRASTVLEIDQRTDSVPAIIDGPTAEDFDVPQFLPAEGRVVLVVREGTPIRVLEKAAAQFLPGELLGVLFVPVMRGRHRSSDAAPDAGQPHRALRSDPEGVAPTAPVAEDRAQHTDGGMASQNTSERSADAPLSDPFVRVVGERAGHARRSASAPEPARDDEPTPFWSSTDTPEQPDEPAGEDRDPRESPSTHDDPGQPVPRAVEGTHVHRSIDWRQGGPARD